MAGTARRNRGGSVDKRAGGRWRARIRNPNTGQLEYLGTYATKTEAQSALRGAETDARRGTHAFRSAGRMALADYAAEWLDHRVNLTPRTRELYRSLLDRYILHTAALDIDHGLGDTAIRDLRSATVRRWYARLPDNTQRPKAYRLLRTILGTAVEDDLIPRNPCNIKGAGKEKAAERPIASIPQVMALADAMPPTLRAAVLLAGFGSLRLGEIAGLQRADVEVGAGKVHVRRQVQRLSDGTYVTCEPKSSSARTVALPGQVMDEVARHLDAHVAPYSDAPVFRTGAGGLLHRRYMAGHWQAASAAVRAVDPTLPANLHFHDLRGSGATLASAQGASLREVMARLGHSSVRAAMIYQHATADRDRAIANLLGRAIDEARG
jgi:integrase